MRNQKRKGVLAAVAVVLLLLLTGCSASNLKVGYISTSVGSEFTASYHHFNGIDSRRIKAEEGEVLSIEYEAEVTRGSLTIWLEQPDGEVIELVTGESEEGTIEIPVEASGTYRLFIKGNSTRGSFGLDWSL